MKIYTLEDLFPTLEMFVSHFTGEINNFLTLSTIDSAILTYELKSIYIWYIHNYTAYAGEKQDVISLFTKRFVFDLSDKYLIAEKKIKHFLSLNNETLFIKGGMTSNTDITPNITNEVFTKQASTPSVVEQAQDFVDAYTDYQSKSTSRHTGTDNHQTTLTRTGSQEDVLKVLGMMLSSISNELIDSVKYNFYIMGDLV